MAFALFPNLKKYFFFSIYYDMNVSSFALEIAFVLCSWETEVTVMRKCSV